MQTTQWLQEDREWGGHIVLHLVLLRVSYFAITIKNLGHIVLHLVLWRVSVSLLLLVLLRVGRFWWTESPPQSAQKSTLESKPAQKRTFEIKSQCSKKCSNEWVWSKEWAYEKLSSKEGSYEKLYSKEGSYEKLCSNIKRGLKKGVTQKREVGSIEVHDSGSFDLKSVWLTLKVFGQSKKCPWWWLRVHVSLSLF